MKNPKFLTFIFAISLLTTSQIKPEISFKKHGIPALTAIVVYYNLSNLYDILTHKHTPRKKKIDAAVSCIAVCSLASSIAYYVSQNK